MKPGKHRNGPQGRERQRVEKDNLDERRRGGRRVLGSDELRVVILKLVSDEPRHGYDLIRAIEDLTSGEYTPSAGVMYPALAVLQDLGLIDETESDGKRRAFSATAKGKAELGDNAEAVKSLFVRLKRLAGPGGGRDIVPVRRAMDNLKSALRSRLHDDGTPKDLVHDVAAIIDETAQRIERL